MPSRRLAIPLLTAAVVAAALWSASRLPPDAAAQAAGVSLVLAALVWLLHAGTPRAALAGALCAFAIATAPAGRPGLLHSVLPALLVTIILTSAATRAGSQRKRQLRTAESISGRSAAQVLANLSVAAIACALPAPWGTAATAGALAECAADTLASEIGVLVPGRVWLITGGWAEPGTDGGITLTGTAAALAGAAAIATVAALTLHFPRGLAIAVAGAGFTGSIADSLLGATLERRGRLGNNQVNLLSTAVAATFALAASLFYSS